jgi:Glycine/sarcosine/betaine reductase selenoprotein B (GRDB)
MFGVVMAMRQQYPKSDRCDVVCSNNSVLARSTPSCWDRRFVLPIDTSEGHFQRSWQAEHGELIAPGDGSRENAMAGSTEMRPVAYMERTRHYYRALGYQKDYIWAYHDEVPFNLPALPMCRSTIALLTTAGPPDRSNRDERNRKQVWSGSVENPPSRFDTDVAWDKEATHVEDRETFLPIDAMKQLVIDGAVGELSHRFHHAPTDYSQAKTSGHDAPAILRRLREDGADAAILVAL